MLLENPLDDVLARASVRLLLEAAEDVEAVVLDALAVVHQNRAEERDLQDEVGNHGERRHQTERVQRRHLSQHADKERERLAERGREDRGADLLGESLLLGARALLLGQHAPPVLVEREEAIDVDVEPLRGDGVAVEVGAFAKVLEVDHGGVREGEGRREGRETTPEQ